MAYFTCPVCGYPLPQGHYQNSRVSNVRVYEEIIRDHGKPLHVEEIAHRAQQKGLILQKRGKNSYSRMVRNSLQGSRRFENKGSNMWWITNEYTQEAV